MNVFVVGGTGAIGTHAVPALVGAAHTVTALARTPEKAAQLSKQGASPIMVSMFDRATLTEAFKGTTRSSTLRLQFRRPRSFSRRRPGPPMTACERKARPPSSTPQLRRASVV